MNRDDLIKRVEESSEIWDVLIIGGGATGLGTALDAASRGFKTLLLEQEDFAKGTSSRSTKLIHGGLRYLQQGNLSLVIEALKERDLLYQNAPHLVHHLPFLVPTYEWWEGPFYGIGLKIYDLLAGKLGLEPSYHLSRYQTLKAIPTLEPKGLRGGYVYYDGQFDDARLAITLVRSIINQGGCAINYLKVIKILKKRGLVIGVIAEDKISGRRYKLYTKTLINATGVFSDDILKLDNPHEKRIISPSQGIHIVLPKSFLSSKKALLIPHTEDKRVLFLVPWHDRVLLGTTDTKVKKIALEPKPREEEIAFLLKHASKYLAKGPTEKDILSIFTGLRPLIKAKSKENTAALSRDHTILVSKSGLITIAGGKWTTYRKMAEDVINKAIIVGSLPDRQCITKHLALHGATTEKTDNQNPLSCYGSDSRYLKEIIKKDASLRKPLHPNLSYCKAEILWAVRKEFAQTVEDVLARRTRALFLDAKASIHIAAKVAKVMANEMGRSTKWQNDQVKQFEKIAKNYHF